MRLLVGRLFRNPSERLARDGTALSDSPGGIRGCLLSALGVKWGRGAGERPRPLCDWPPRSASSAARPCSLASTKARSSPPRAKGQPDRAVAGDRRHHTTTSFAMRRGCATAMQRYSFAAPLTGMLAGFVLIRYSRILISSDGCGSAGVSSTYPPSSARHHGASRVVGSRSHC